MLIIKCITIYVFFLIVDITEIHSNPIPKKATGTQHQHFMNYLIKNQQKFIHDILETQKKWNMEMIDKIHEHQAAQLKIIMAGFSKESSKNTKICNHCI